MADQRTRIVSLTVTEGGYNFHAVTGRVRRRRPGRRCTTCAGRGAATTFGLVTEALDRRRAARRWPAVHRHVLRQHPGQRRRRPHAASPPSPGLRDAELGDWVRAGGAVPELHGRPDHPGHHGRRPRRSGARSSASRTAGRWSASRSPSGCSRTTSATAARRCEDAGVQVVADVEPYELMKLRLLNASHQALCYFGYLAGYRLVHEVCQDPLFAEFLLGYMDREATPTLQPVPGIDLRRLQAGADRAVLQPRRSRDTRRPAVRGELRPDPEVAAAGDPAQPGDRRGDRPRGRRRRALGPLRRGRRRAGRADRGRRPAQGHADGRRPPQREDPLAFVRNRELFGDLVDDERFTSTFRRYLASLHEHGARATVEGIVRGTR